MDAHRNRSEFKFLIQPGLGPVLRDAIATHLEPDRGLVSGYVVLTEYFDSPSLTCYWQKNDGVPNRRRLRSRIYVDPSGTREPAAFIEIKHKLSGLTVKRRIASSLTEIAGFSAGRLPTRSPGVCPKIHGEIIRFVADHDMRPRAQIRYHRHAYDSGRDGTLRITFDHDILSRISTLHPLSIHNDAFETPLVRPGCSLMEVKTIGPVPGWFRELCGTLGLVPASFSKYAAAIHPLMRRHAPHTLPSSTL